VTARTVTISTSGRGRNSPDRWPRQSMRCCTVASKCIRCRTSPSRHLSLEALAREWFGARIAVQIPG
jgi:hypothetical protein